MPRIINNRADLTSYNCTNSTSIKSPTKASSYFDKIKLDLSAVLPVYLIVLVVCLIGNIIVCITVLRSKEMRRKRWYYFLMNLSVADVGLALTTLSHLLQLQGVDVGDIGCKLGNHLLYAFLSVSTTTIAYISIDRYLGLCRTNFNQTRRPRPKIVIPMIWLSTFIYLIPFFIYCKKNTFPDNSNSCDCFHAWPSKQRYLMYNVTVPVLCMFLPFAVIIVCYWRISVKLWGTGSSDVIPNDATGNKKRSIKMLMLSASSFFIFLFPYGCLFLLKKFQAGDPRLIGKLWLSFQVLAFCNSAWNPYIYCFFSTNFRDGFKAAFFWKKRQPVTYNVSPGNSNGDRNHTKPICVIANKFTTNIKGSSPNVV